VMDQRVTLPPFSMLSQTPIYSVNGNIVTGLLNPPIVPDASDTLYRVTLAGERRLDLISQLHYGTPELWWVIALVNNLIDPIAGVASGAEIRIPLRSRLSALGILNV
jgi:hypothetical protein